MLLLYVREALNALGGRRLQVFLATFGVAVGVASMVFLVAMTLGGFFMELNRSVDELARLVDASRADVR